MPLDLCRGSVRGSVLWLWQAENLLSRPARAGLHPDAVVVWRVGAAPLRQGGGPCCEAQTTTPIVQAPDFGYFAVTTQLPSAAKDAGALSSRIGPASLNSSVLNTMSSPSVPTPSDSPAGARNWENRARRS